MQRSSPLLRETEESVDGAYNPRWGVLNLVFFLCRSLPYRLMVQRKSWSHWETARLGYTDNYGLLRGPYLQVLGDEDVKPGHPILNPIFGRNEIHIRRFELAIAQETRFDFHADPI